MKAKLYDVEIGEIILVNGVPHFIFSQEYFDSHLNINPILFPKEKYCLFAGKPISFRNLSETFYGLPGFIADCLPDKFGNDLVVEWLKLQNRAPSSLNIIERLSYVGNRAIGAIEFEPSQEERDIGNIDIPSIFDIVELVLSKKTSLNEQMEKNKISRHNVEQIISIGTSAGGARAKAIIAIDKNNKVISGTNNTNPEFTNYLIKFDSALNSDKEEKDGSGHTNVEFAYYNMSKDCGINMSECHLLKQDKMYHFLTKRFDRYVEDGQVKKLHMITLCGILHKDFNVPRCVDYKDVFDVIDKIVPPEYVKQDKEEMFKRLVFNIFARNQDDHTKNTAFTLDARGTWRLSPFYDVTFAFNPNGQWTSKHQMSVLSYFDNKEITNNVLLELGKQVGLDKQFCLSQIKLTENVLKNARKYFLDAHVGQDRIDKMMKYLRVNFNKNTLKP